MSATMFREAPECRSYVDPEFGMLQAPKTTTPPKVHQGSFPSVQKVGADKIVSTVVRLGLHVGGPPGRGHSCKLSLADDQRVRGLGQSLDVLWLLPHVVGDALQLVLHLLHRGACKNNRRVQLEQRQAVTEYDLRALFEEGANHTTEGSEWQHMRTAVLQKLDSHGVHIKAQLLQVPDGLCSVLPLLPL
eukprot:CAMPEP_0168476334 /NCGR_PEP_ID=MMETSP0228-20121227/61839_1 /TAXON_ID=133427 /ORGANISM="Protoceratium reticulatum, Strain CCCM 535 (=CCMP 1889)" /LENGTH=188 /DNA_ID=CAMNT_0008492461 /DNA_START=44 /DNA_END=607 /DNA_ORIENTATION=+